MKSVQKQRGVFSIEFALGAIVLFLTTFAVFEICRFIYIVNLTETALRESARDTRVYEETENYRKRFMKVFKEQDTLWHYLIEPKKRYKVKIDYFKDYPDLVKGKIVKKCPTCQIAQYTLTYSYSPALRVPGIKEKIEIRRSILMVQEHEGWESDEK